MSGTADENSSPAAHARCRVALAFASPAKERVMADIGRDRSSTSTSAQSSAPTSTSSSTSSKSRKPTGARTAIPSRRRTSSLIGRTESSVTTMSLPRRRTPTGRSLDMSLPGGRTVVAASGIGSAGSSGDAVSERRLSATSSLWRRRGRCSPTPTSATLRHSDSFSVGTSVSSKLIQPRQSSTWYSSLSDHALKSSAMW